jgi:hypothetical protein
MSARKISETTKQLMAARKLIEKEENWTKGAAARDRTGVSVNYAASDAYSFCIVGALARAKVKAGSKVYYRGNGGSIVLFNDYEARHSDILAFLDEAIAQSVAEDQL